MVSPRCFVGQISPSFDQGASAPCPDAAKVAQGRKSPRRIVDRSLNITNLLDVLWRTLLRAFSKSQHKLETGALWISPRQYSLTNTPAIIEVAAFYLRSNEVFELDERFMPGATW